jgi:polysaccharide export outer membrane protein
MRKLPALLIALTLSACGTLPQDGPSTKAVVTAGNPAVAATYGLVDLTFPVAELVSQPVSLLRGGLTSAPNGRPYDIIAAGDVLAVSVYEPGGALFGSPTVATGGAPATTNQALPPLQVDRSGSITIPFGGRVQVAGLTAQQAGDAVRRSLQGRAVNPQVLVAIESSASTAVTVLGAARTPGRQPLRPGADTILDVIAAAGGPANPPEDIVVSVTRAGQVYEAPLTSLLSTPGENAALAPGDQINLIVNARRYSTFGALGRVSEVAMPTGDVTLTGALSVAGGLDNQSSDARSVFVFRFERPEVAAALGVTAPATTRGVPVVYRLNMAEPTAFFTAGSFIVHPGDVIYNPRARSAEIRKFFEFVQAMTRVVYDVTVTGTLGNN